MDDIERRVRFLEDWAKAADRRFEKLREELLENSGVTRSVKEDTEQIVELFRASKVSLSIVKWLAMVASGVGALWAAWRHLP